MSAILFPRISYLNFIDLISYFKLIMDYNSAINFFNWYTLCDKVEPVYQHIPNSYTLDNHRNLKNIYRKNLICPQNLFIIILKFNIIIKYHNIIKSNHLLSNYLTENKNLLFHILLQSTNNYLGQLPPYPVYPKTFPPLLTTILLLFSIATILLMN